MPSVSFDPARGPPGITGGNVTDETRDALAGAAQLTAKSTPAVPPAGTVAVFGFSATVQLSATSESSTARSPAATSEIVRLSLMPIG